MTEQQREQRGISRRTIAKGAAWAVPALPIVAATPAYAKSGGGPTMNVTSACKQPGNSCNTGQKPYGFIKGYTFLVTITNPTSEVIYVYPTLANIDNPDIPPPDTTTLNPFFQVTSSVPFSYNTARRWTGDISNSPLLNQSEAVDANGGTLTIIINAGQQGNSANTDATGVLYMAWGHTSGVGADPDHPYAPSPHSTPPPAPTAVGEGWFYDAFAFASTPPCGTDCAPGGDETEEN